LATDTQNQNLLEPLKGFGENAESQAFRAQSYLGFLGGRSNEFKPKNTGFFSAL
jgi:hypothetical protein